jgi:hypothetical protein
MKRVTTRPHDPGLRIFHDIRNNKFPLAAKRPLSATFTPRTVHHRQYQHYDQGPTPRCTGYGMATLCSAAHEYNRPPISPDDWYARNQAHDRAEGRYYDEGATVVAALEVGRSLGIWSAYRWLYTLTELQQAIVLKPVVLGTYWFDSMFERDEDGNVTEPDEDEETDAGHLYVVNGYEIGTGPTDPTTGRRQNRWRVPNTWNDGDYWISDRLMHRLLRDGGEAAQADEIRLPRVRAA